MICSLGLEEVRNFNARIRPHTGRRIGQEIRTKSFPTWRSSSAFVASCVLWNLVEATAKSGFLA